MTTDIIAQGPIIEEPGCHPFRVVLRKQPKGDSAEYVVHTQALPVEGRPFFFRGDYYHGPDAYRRAIQKFTGRILEHTGIRGEIPLDKLAGSQYTVTSDQ